MFIEKTKEHVIPFEKLYTNPNLVKDFKDISISATSIFEVTGIPRATCIRKLELLIKLNTVQQDNITKRYRIIPEIFSQNLASRHISKKIVEIFSKFFFIYIRTSKVKTLK